MKKIFALVLILTLALFVVSACAADEEPAATPTPTPEATPTPTPTPEPEPEPEDDEEYEEVEDYEEVVVPPIAFLPPPTPPGYVWSMMRDEGLQTMPLGTIGTGYDFFAHTPYIMQAGSPTFQIVETPWGGHGIELLFRGETWHALDIVTSNIDFNFDANTYRVIVRGRVADPSDTVVILGGADAPWGWLFHTYAHPENGTFTIVGIIDADLIEAAGERGQLRIQTNNLVDLAVYDITIVEVPQGYVWTLSTDPGVQSHYTGAVGPGGDILVHTPFLTQAGAPTFQIIPGLEAGRNGLSLIFRGENWHALDIPNAPYRFNFDAHTYEIVITGSVSDAAGTYFILGGADDPWGWLANVVPDDDGSFVLTGTITANTIEAAGERGQLRIQTNNLVDIYLYEITIRVAG